MISVRYPNPPYSPQMAVTRGMALLDEVAPGWENVVHLGRMNIASAASCVLAQTIKKHEKFRGKVMRRYPDTVVSFSLADEYLRAGHFSYDAGSHGFVASMFCDYYQLTDAWREAILARRAENKKKAKAAKSAPKQADYTLAV